MTKAVSNRDFCFLKQCYYSENTRICIGLIQFRLSPVASKMEIREVLDFSHEISQVCEYKPKKYIQFISLIF